MLFEFERRLFPEEEEEPIVIIYYRIPLHGFQSYKIKMFYFNKFKKLQKKINKKDIIIINLDNLEDNYYDTCSKKKQKCTFSANV